MINKDYKLKDGKLSDIAPTILYLLNSMGRFCVDNLNICLACKDEVKIGHIKMRYP